MQPAATFRWMIGNGITDEEIVNDEAFRAALAAAARPAGAED